MHKTFSAETQDEGFGSALENAECPQFPSILVGVGACGTVKAMEFFVVASITPGGEC